MSVNRFFIKIALFCSIAACSQQSAFAAIKVSENFESGWNGVPWTAYSNAVTNASGWVVNQAKIATNSFTTSTNADLAGVAGNDAWVQSPLLTNGAGSVSFSVVRPSATSNNSVTAEVQYQGSTNWVTIEVNPVLTNALVSFTNFINSSSNLYVRLRKTISSGGGFFRLHIDDILITYPAPTITNISVSLSPPLPMENDAMSVTGAVSVVGVVESFAATNFWRTWPNTNWTAIPMATNQPNIFATITNIPGLPSGSTLDYFVRASYAYTQSVLYTTSTVYTVPILPRSSYTNMLITTSPSNSMQLGRSYQWQGVAYITNSNPTFKFKGAGSSGSPLWGDINQTVTTLPLHGTAETNGANITLYTTNSGYYVFTFNETNLAYEVRSCTYENLATWTNSSFLSSGVHTNNGNWILSGGLITNDSSRSLGAVLNGPQGGVTNFIKSPQLTNGLGPISFWYRNGSPTGTPTTAISVQVAPNTNSTSWTTLSTITNISSATYLFTSIPYSDLDNQCLRIVNHGTGTASRVWLDDIVIGSPNPSVSVSGLTNSPASPSPLDPVTISINLTPRNGAVITNVVAWYRNATSNLAFESISMTLSNGQYLTTSPIPATIGTVQYAVQYYFTGYQAASPASTLTNTYTVSSPALDPRYQDFETAQLWPGVPWAGYSNAVTNATGWIVNQAKIYTNTSDQSVAGELQGATAASNAWIQSPLLTNGVGSVTYSMRAGGSPASNSVSVEVQFSGDPTWVPVATNNISINTPQFYTNFFNSTNIQSLRLRKIIPGAFAQRLLIDNIRITYPPADVAITNITCNPGYPQAGQSVSFSCDITSVNPIFSALNITPTLWWYPIGGKTNSVSMPRTSGNRYTTLSAIALTNVTRDVPVYYWVKCDFAGYSGTPSDNRSPRSSPTNYFIVRASSSAYEAVGVSVNGALTTGRLLTNGIWQTVFTTASTNALSFTFKGSGYSAGNGYSTNITQWGNTNNWQTSLPLSDFSTTGQTSFTISSSNAFSGQYVLRFDESTGRYIILRCVAQDFDNWLSNDDLYKLEATASTPTVKDLFNTWTKNNTQVRSEPFTDLRWTNAVAYTEFAAEGPVNYGIFSSRVLTNTLITTNAPLKGRSFIAQDSRSSTEESTQPLKGIGTISFSYRCASSTNNSLGVFLYTNTVSDPLDYTVDSRWLQITNFSVSNTTIQTFTLDLNTNATADIIIAHLTGSTNVLFDDISISEWYADAQTNSGWITSEAWVESKPGDLTDLRVRFDTSRADAGVEQSITTCMLTNGVNAITFDCSSASTAPVSFTLASRTGPFGSWSNLTSQTISGFNGTGTDYTNISWTIATPATNTYLKIIHTTNAPGVLLVDNVKVSSAAVGATWEINNTAVDDSDQPIPPQTLGARQYYDGFATLNFNRTSNLATGASLPYTNTWPYIVSPILTPGIGEISFWYRNWTTNGTVTPARLIIQTTTNSLATTNAGIWKTEAILDGIVNTNDYRYYSTIVNSYSSRYVRIYNDDQYTSKVGRVCIDDILVAEPLAATLSMSNLVITPTIPLYSNRVQIAADIHKLFLAPSNITLTAYYATATTYAALSSATPIPLGMTCIASNPGAPGEWYRYQTTNGVPTNAVDTFVKYYVQASYSGYQAASTSPRQLSTFSSYPAWYAPMDQVYTNGIAYYVVYSCPTGSVWINEISPLDYDGVDTWIFTNEFIELCGPSGASIKNWTLELVDINANPLALYSITNNAALHSPTNGHGFWVIGVTNISGIDQVLTTNATDDPGVWEPSIGERKMPVFGGIKLRRSWGPVERAVFYNTDISLVPDGYSLTAVHPIDNNSGSIGLTGTGTNYGDFGWLELANATPGSVNQWQTLVGVTPQGTPVFYIYGISINTNVWIECTKAANWHTIPWYSTNILSSNSWVAIPAFTRSTNGTNDLLNFNRATNSKAYYYKVVATNAP